MTHRRASERLKTSAGAQKSGERGREKDASRQKTESEGAFMMFKNKRAGLKPSGDLEKKREQGYGYGKWLFRKKGTAAEPWPTAEDLWNDPKVQKALKNHRELIKKRNGL